MDAKTKYSLNLEVNTGTQPEEQYKMSNKPHDVVDRFVRPISQSGRNFTMDNWFISYPTFENLLNHHKLTAVGTMKFNKICIPAKFKAGIFTSLRFSTELDFGVVHYKTTK